MRRSVLALLALMVFCAVGPLAGADKAEEKKPEPEKKRRPSDVVFILIETSEFDADSVAELQTLYEVLRKLDPKNTGKIDPEALKSARQQIVEDRVTHIFGELDVNKDGKISKEEAKGRIKEHFDRIDANKDGFIDRDELLHAILEHAKAAKEAPDKK
jgi:Ca2+-binding EF-hand superfamily protein